MGTKNNPGEFDCYESAGDDEPMFVLLGRDPFAPQLVRAWAALRQAAGDDDHKVREALECAEAMRLELRHRGRMEAPYCLNVNLGKLAKSTLTVLKGR